MSRNTTSLIHCPLYNYLNNIFLSFHLLLYSLLFAKVVFCLFPRMFASLWLFVYTTMHFSNPCYVSIYYVQFHDETWLRIGYTRRLFLIISIMLDAKNISSYIAPQPLYIKNMRLRRTFYTEWCKSVLYSPLFRMSK